jgi:hypothetical protein
MTKRIRIFTSSISWIKPNLCIQLTSCFHYIHQKRKIKHNRVDTGIFWHERMMIMFNGTVLYIPRSQAIVHAARELERIGITTTEKCAPDVTHLLLPVPSFEADGSIKGGGDLQQLLKALPKTVTVIGGNLDREELAGYETLDLLKDPRYLARNASITAHCALELALAKLPVTLENCPVLVIGWGRIGKCLAKLFGALGAKVTVAARRESRRVMAEALGYRSCAIAQIRCANSWASSRQSP